MTGLPLLSALPGSAFSGWCKAVLPGLLLCLAVAGVAMSLARLEMLLTGGRWIDGLVLSIALGTALNSLIPLHSCFAPGIRFAAKQMLELAIVCLGATLSLQALQSQGSGLLLAVAAMVPVAIMISYGLGRLLGLPQRLALLVACGNSICGNSAIVATAPVLRAEGEEVAAAIAFTAALGIVLVLLLPLLPGLLGLDAAEYGILAGMTVYAVPQVLAATAPASALSTQIGTVVKLIRVLMLGPVVFCLGLLMQQRNSRRQDPGKPSLRPGQLLPWFIPGFALMFCLRAGDVLSDDAATLLGETSSALTLMAMAALGLSVNLRMVFSLGGRVLAAGALSLLSLTGLGLIVIFLAA